MHQAQQRQSVLQALVSVTRELTSVRGVGEAMSLLVRMTRTLLRADMAYLSLNDDGTSTTYIRETDGVTTEGYRTIRMPLGSGVLGRVAQSNGPFQTSGYLDDPDVASDSDTRDRVRGEGVVSILGAPVRIGGTIIGALLVADRRQRHYDAHAVAALESLATHAAAVLENARLFEELSENLSRTEEARAEAARVAEELGQLREAEQILMSSLANLADLDTFAVTLSEVLGLEAIVVEAARVPAILGAHARPGEIAALRRELEEPLSPGDIVRVREPIPRSPEDLGGKENGQRWNVLAVVPASLGNRVLGVVGVRGEPTSVQRLILHRAAVALSALLAFQEALEASGAWERSELLEALLAGRARSELPSLVRRAAEYGLRLGEPSVVVIVEPVVAEVRRVVDLVGTLVAGAGISRARNGQIVAIVNAENAEELATDWATRLASRGMNATVAAESVAPGGEFVGATSELNATAAVPEAYQHAEAVRASAHRLGRRGEACTQAMLGAAALVISGDAGGVTDRMIRFTVGPLIDYDRDRGTQLIPTALAYLDHNQRTAATAESLHVHENTVRQRLGRVDELLGEQWRQGTRCLDAHLALRLYQLSKSDDHTI